MSFLVFVWEKHKVGWVGRWESSVRSQGKGKHHQNRLSEIVFQLRVIHCVQLSGKIIFIFLIFFF